MARTAIELSWRRRLLTWAVVLVLHLGAALVLLRAFAPEAIPSSAQSAIQAVAVALSPPPPSVLPKVSAKKEVPSRHRQSAGASAPPAALAQAHPQEAPPAPIPLLPEPVPTALGDGAEMQNGGAQAGRGSGASGAGTGTGTGAGDRGNGIGGGGGSLPVKIAGDINSARDYPRASRDQRINSQVVIALTVATDGRVKACRVLKPSPDAQAGPITCDLAMKRFRFRPATDAAGRPVEAQFGWQQRWFY